jgi:hypothetical protein
VSLQFAKQRKQTLRVDMEIRQSNQITAPNCRQALRFRGAGILGCCIRWRRPIPAAVGEFCR